MCREEWVVRDNKMKLYTWLVLIFALAFGLPVVQLVLVWLKTVELSGNMDLCWYNFACARPFLGLYAFNNVFR